MIFLLQFTWKDYEYCCWHSVRSFTLIVILVIVCLRSNYLLQPWFRRQEMRRRKATETRTGSRTNGHKATECWCVCSSNRKKHRKGLPLKKWKKKTEWSSKTRADVKLIWLTFLWVWEWLKKKSQSQLRCYKTVIGDKFCFTVIVRFHPQYTTEIVVSLINDIYSEILEFNQSVTFTMLCKFHPVCVSKVTLHHCGVTLVCCWLV